MNEFPNETLVDLLNDPAFVDRLEEIRLGIANLERLDLELDRLWAEAKEKPGLTPEDRKRVAQDINDAKELLRRSWLAEKLVTG